MEPWFDVTLSWIPGTALGVTAGFVGALSGLFAPKGIGRSIVLGLLCVLISISVALLVAGIVAYIQGQPYGIWYGLGLAGVIGTLVLLPNYFVIRKRYTEAEMRKIDAAAVEGD